MATPTAKFRISATDATKSAFRSVRRGLKSIAKAVFSLKTGIGVLAGVAGFGLLVKSSLKAIDRIGKLSKTYGIATKQLATFQLAAELGGSSLDTFAKAARNVSKNVFDFVVRSTGEAVDAFEFLGITTEQLRPIMNDNVAIIGLIGDKFNEMEDGAIKTALAVKLLGGRAVELLPALEGGTEQFAKLTKETELFGTALSASAVKGVERANDSILRLGFVFRGLRDQTVSALAPALELVTTTFRNFILESAEASGGIEGFAKKIAVSILETVQSALGALKILQRGAERVLSLIPGVFDSGQKSAAQLNRELVNVDAALVRITNRLMDPGIFDRFFEARFQKRRQELIEIKVELRRAINDAGEAGEGVIDQLSVTVDKLIKKVEQGNRAAGELFKPRAGALTAGTTATDEAIERKRLQLDTEITLLRESLLTEEEQIRGSNERRLILLQEQLAARTATEDQARELTLLKEIELEEKLTAIASAKAAERQAIEANVAQAINSMRLNTFQLGATLLRSLAGQNRIAAIAVIAIQKGLSIAQVIMNTQVAAMRALAELGPIRGAAAAVKIRALGRISVGLIAAAGVLEARGVGGGGAALGTPANPIQTIPQQQGVTLPAAASVVPQRNVTILVPRGALLSTISFRDEIVPMIEAAINDGALNLNVELVA